jgi:hypothetical protein
MISGILFLRREYYYEVTITTINNALLDYLASYSQKVNFTYRLRLDLEPQL